MKLTSVFFLSLLLPVFISCNVKKQEKADDQKYHSKEDCIKDKHIDYKYYTVNGVEFKMIAIKGGTFSMGSVKGAFGAEDDEYPQHKVTVSDFYLAETEVTQELWTAVMGNNPSGYTDDAQLPVESVTWDDCQRFLTELNKLTDGAFRLPTEAEWEYAARGGNCSKGFLYSGSDTLANVGWYKDNANERPHKVKQLAPNELGLYDMSGNIWEWCNDWEGQYPSEEVVNPQGPQEGRARIVRGGSWLVDAAICRPADRSSGAPRGGGCIVGLRLAL